MKNKLNELAKTRSEYELIKTLLYKGTDGAVILEVILDRKTETMWATQKTIANLFKVTVNNISKHLNNIFDSKELDKDKTTLNPNNSTNSGIPLINLESTKQPILYNLDTIISVGYRVRDSKEATRFRIWATKILKDYMIKGYVLNKELLTEGSPFGEKYFKHLIEEIRDIRSSERQIYEKVTDIYATSYDYEPKAEITKEFFANVQNKLHYAITGLTAPEIIKDRASSDKENMGLTTWRKAPEGKILLRDTKIAKNYLNKKEIRELNRVVSMYLDYAENQAERNIPMSMEDWATRLDKFLEFNEYHILYGKGSISREDIDNFVKNEYDKFRPLQDVIYKSDYNKFEEEVKRIEGRD